MSSIDSWADFLQPTPLSVEFERQYHQVGAPKLAQPPAQGTADPANTSKIAAQVLQTHFQQLAQQPKNAEAQQLLQSLLEAAQSQVAPIPPQMQQLQQTQPQPPLNMLGSGMIEPLHASSSSVTHQDSFNDSVWKAFFDDEEDSHALLNKMPSGTVVGASTANNKRRFDRGGDVMLPPPVSYQRDGAVSIRFSRTPHSIAPL
jgi:hypothetical protein